MKKIILSITFLLLLAQFKLRAQALFDTRISFTKNPSSVNTDNGLGFGFGFLSEGKLLGKRDTTALFMFYDNKLTYEYPGQPDKIKMQVGGDLHYSGLGSKTFYNVPVLAPQTGTSKVFLANTVLNINAKVRLSLPNLNLHYIPYIDLFGGYRHTVSDLTITPDGNGNCYCGPTNQTLSSVNGINYGVGAGVLVPLNSDVNICAEISYLNCIQDGKIPDINSAYADSNGINLNMKNSPNGLMTFNIGLAYNINPSVSSGGTSGSTSHSHSSSGGGSGGSSGCGGGHVGVHTGGGGRAK